MATHFRRLRLAYVSSVIAVLFLPASLFSQGHPIARKIMLDSIAWVPQSLPIPGVVAGNAIWFDFNNDGRLDILMAGMSELGPVSGVYRNDSSTFVKIQAGITPLISERGLTWGDLDNDGNLDFAIEGRPDTLGAQPVSKVYLNDSGGFGDMMAQIMNLNGGSVTWADFDNDGHLDLLLCGSPDQGGTFYTKLYRIIDGKFYEVDANLPGVWGSSIAWADYDNDGYVDLVISGYGYGAQTRLFHNAMSRGVTGFDEVDSPVNGQASFRAVNSGCVIWFDYDNDGYSDLLVTGAGVGGPVGALYHNSHDGSFQEVVTTLKGVSVSAAAVGDYDNDGYMDIAISGGDDFATGSNPTTKIYHNGGDGTFTDIGARLVGTWFGSLDWGDYDNDGRLDLLVTGATIPRDHATYGADLKPVTVLYKNTLFVDGNSSPTVPNGLTAEGNADQVSLTWNAASDTETAQMAITYNIMVGSRPGSFDIVSPLSSPSSGFRRMPKSGSQGTRTTAKIRNLPPGTYYWRVQAVDNQFAGSGFSEEKSFTVSTSSITDGPLLPIRFGLAQNYPNPFNPSTEIQYTIHDRQSTSLKVFDLLGREVATLVNEVKTPGTYAVKFDGSGLASGVYLYRLRAGDFVHTRKLLLLR